MQRNGKSGREALSFRWGADGAALAPLICCGALLAPALIGSAGFAALAGKFLNPAVQVTALALFVILVGIAWKRKLFFAGFGNRLGSEEKGP